METFRFLFILFIAGCSSGEQQGRYAVSTVRISTYDNPSGFVVVFFGNRLSPDFEVLESESALLCIVYVADNKYSGGYDATSMQHDRNTSEFSLCAGDTSFDVFWNRKDGSIKVENNTFDLKDGNVVVLTQSGEDAQFSLGSECSDIISVIEAIAGQEQSPAAVANWAGNGTISP